MTKVIKDPDKPDYYLFACPGCGGLHWFKTVGNRPCWSFNDDLNNPTVSPSILNRWDFKNRIANKICHLFIKNGKIQYCNDSTHDLAGQTVEMTDYENW